MSAEMLRAYCICGATAEAASVPCQAARDIIHVFLVWHSGAGHGVATRQQAAVARARTKRLMLQEDARDAG